MAASGLLVQHNACMCSNASIGVPWGLYEAVGPYGGVISVPRRVIESFAARIGAHYVCRRRREGRAAECEKGVEGDTSERLVHLAERGVDR